jgi:hypothetical protein
MAGSVHLMAHVQRPQQRSEVRQARLDDEILLYYPSRATALRLTASAAAIWDLCSGERTLVEMTNVLAAAYPDAAVRLRDEIEQVLETLAAHDVIEWR